MSVLSTFDMMVMMMVRDAFNVYFLLFQAQIRIHAVM
jgi:hypothetical protein